RAYTVLAQVSLRYSVLKGTFPRVTHPCATNIETRKSQFVRLACVRPAASVRSEPGSNSQVDLEVSCKNYTYPAPMIAHRRVICVGCARYVRQSTERRLRIPFVRLFTMSKSAEARHRVNRLKSRKTRALRRLTFNHPSAREAGLYGERHPPSSRI